MVIVPSIIMCLLFRFRNKDSTINKEEADNRRITQIGHVRDQTKGEDLWDNVAIVDNDVMSTPRADVLELRKYKKLSNGSVELDSVNIM